MVANWRSCLFVILMLSLFIYFVSWWCGRCTCSSSCCFICLHTIAADARTNLRMLINKNVMPFIFFLNVFCHIIGASYMAGNTFVVNVIILDLDIHVSLCHAGWECGTSDSSLSCIQLGMVTGKGQSGIGPPAAGWSCLARWPGPSSILLVPCFFSTVCHSFWVACCNLLCKFGGSIPSGHGLINRRWNVSFVCFP